jgi:hypothetical protein
MPTSRSWTASSIRIVGFGTALAALLMLTAGTWRYARQRNAAFDYLDDHMAGITFAPQPTWWPKRFEMPRWMRSVEKVGVRIGVDPAEFTALYELRHLMMSRSRELNDHDMRSIARFRRLTSLDVSDPDFREMRRPESRVTDEGLRHLAALPLTTLRIASPHITDTGLRHLRDLPLVELALRAPSISDNGLEHIIHMPVKSLSINDAPISDAGLAQLKGMSLESLDLDGTKVSLHGLLVLREMKSLKKISETIPRNSRPETDAIIAAGIPIEPGETDAEMQERWKRRFLKSQAERAKALTNGLSACGVLCGDCRTAMHGSGTGHNKGPASAVSWRFLLPTVPCRAVSAAHRRLRNLPVAPMHPWACARCTLSPLRRVTHEPEENQHRHHRSGLRRRVHSDLPAAPERQHVRHLSAQCREAEPDRRSVRHREAVHELR